MFSIHFATSSFPAPHLVAIMTPGNDWSAITGQYVDGIWIFTLDETQIWNESGYFKFLLDGRFWMDGPYIRIAPAAGDIYKFDDSEVSFPMSSQPITPPSAPTAATPAAGTTPADRLPLIGGGAVTEGAITNRLVALLTPVFAAVAAGLAGWAAKHVPGVKLDQTQVVSFMISIVGICLTTSWKWLQGWQQHEMLVAQKFAAPIKPVVAPPGSGLGSPAGNAP